MGFINPGRSHRKKRGPPSNDELKKIKKAKLKESKLSHNAISGLCMSKSPSLESALPVEEEDHRSQFESLSLLEKLPVEILHEVFLFAGVNNLPFVNKLLNHRLTPSNSLRYKMLKLNYVHDLNQHIEDKKASESDWKTRFALDRSILDYKFVNSKILSRLKFDIVLPLPTIKAESKNRLIQFYDNLNKKLIEAMNRADSDPQTIANEISRMTRERLEMDVLDENELSVLPTEEFQDYTEKLYNGPFDEDRLKVLEELHKRQMRFIDGELVLSNAIRKGCVVKTLDRLLKLTKSTRITTSKPLIEAFEEDSMEISQWCFNNFENQELINDDNLWIHVSRSKKIGFLHFLQERGGTPSHDILGIISSIQNA